MGPLYLSDWVDKSYPVHGKGRIWRIRSRKASEDDGLRPARIAGLETARLGSLLGHPRQEIRATATEALAHKWPASKEVLIGVLQGKSETRARLHALWAAARVGNEAASLIESALTAPEPEVRAEAVRLLPPGIEARHEKTLLERARKDPSPPVRMQAILRSSRPGVLQEVIPFLAEQDPFLLSAALQVLGQQGKSELLLSQVESAYPRLRLGVLLALRRTSDPRGPAVLGQLLKDADPAIRRAAIQWVGEEKLEDWAPRLNAAATAAPVTRDLFQALVAANHLLGGGKPEADPVDPRFLLRVVQDGTQPAVFRLLALQSLRPEHPALTAATLGNLLSEKDAALRREAVRTLSLRSDRPAQQLLLKLAGDQAVEPGLAPRPW